MQNALDFARCTVSILYEWVDAVVVWLSHQSLSMMLAAMSLAGLISSLLFRSGATNRAYVAILRPFVVVV